MKLRQEYPSDPNRRTFLKLAAAAGASFAASSDAVARTLAAITGTSGYGGLLEKTEEYQEAFLVALPEPERSDLLSKIRKLRPEATSKLLSQGELAHVLRTGYVALKLGESRIPRNPSARTAVAAWEILVPSRAPLRPPMPANASYRASFFRNMPDKVEPFDLFASENRALAINGNYGAFDGGLCREHTWDWRPLDSFLTLAHGDYVEMAPTEAYGEIWREFIGNGVRMPSASIDANTGTPLCSQTVRRLGESLWLPFARGDSALSSLATYGKSRKKYLSFSEIPESKTVADVFMKSLAHPSFGHRAFAFRSGTEWFVVDPYSHGQPISAAQYRRRKDIFAIVAFG